jgi:Glycosyltransferase family 87
VGFFALALAIREDDRGHEFWSGLALCLCLYKPTLLVLALPMLALTRRVKALLGFAIGLAALVLTTTAFEGFTVWPHFVAALHSFGNSSIGIESHSFLPLAKYVDLTSFSSAIPGGRSWLGLVFFCVVGLSAITFLLRFWWKSAAATEPGIKTLVWATTLTWTLLINVYVPIYDSILIVLSVLLTAAFLPKIRVRFIHWSFTVNWILILVCSWISVPVSRATGVQILTLLFTAFGFLQFAMLGKITHRAAALENDPAA